MTSHVSALVLVLWLLLKALAVPPTTPLLRLELVLLLLLLRLPPPPPPHLALRASTSALWLVITLQEETRFNTTMRREGTRTRAWAVLAVMLLVVLLLTAPLLLLWPIDSIPSNTDAVREPNTALSTICLVLR